MEYPLNSVVEQIIDHMSETEQFEANLFDNHPDRNAIIQIIESLQQVLYPHHFSEGRIATETAYRYELRDKIDMLRARMAMQISKALSYSKEYRNASLDEKRTKAEEEAIFFMQQIPEIQKILDTDLQATYDGDPAASDKDEIIYCYPGFMAIMVHRIAHVLYTMNIPLIPRIMSEYAHSLTGVDIHPGATIGKYFFIDHGTGVVIGETTIIGEHVKIYQGVTLGGLTTRGGQSLAGKKRHPTIENDVTIYSNASILGGETVIGEGCVIGGNCFITKSIPANMRVSFTSPELQIREGHKN